jgi:nitrate/nitrite transporter NarK
VCVFVCSFGVWILWQALLFNMPKVKVYFKISEATKAHGE